MLPNAVIDNDRQLGIHFLRSPKHSEAVTFRQPQVRQDDGWVERLQRLDGFSLIASFDDGVSLSLECVAQHRPQRVLVLDEQNRRIG